MSSEYSLDDIVTDFLLETCRLRPRQTKAAVQAAGSTCSLAVIEESECIPLTTGSLAEFYIEPMLKLAGDIDVMFHRDTELAIPRGHPPPTQLPGEFHNYVQVMEIIDSHSPGYVCLDLRYLLTMQ